MKIKDIMTPDPITVPPGMTIEAVVQLLLDRRISAVFVTDTSGMPLGVVSEGDLIRRLVPDKDADLGGLARIFINQDGAAGRYVKTHGTQVRDVMTGNLAAVSEDDTLAAAVTMMQRRGVRRLAVLRTGRLVGVVARANLLRALLAGHDSIAVANDDDRIRLAIGSELRRHSWGDEPYASVVVQNGVVRLEGYCLSEESREAFRVAAERVGGVEHVVNNLEVNLLMRHPMFSGI